MTNTSQNIYITYRINSGKVLCFYLSCFRVFVVRNVQLQAGTVNNHPPAAPFSNGRAPCIACRLSLPSAAGDNRPARERDFQVFTKPTTRTGSSFKLVSLLDFDFCPLSFAETGTVKNTSHALVYKQRNPCTNQSPANRITKYPC